MAQEGEEHVGKSVFIGLSALLAILAAVGSWVANAHPSAPHWIDGAVVIRHETHVPITSARQNLAFDLTKSGAAVSCKVAFEDVVTNPLNEEMAGIDEMAAFQTKKCVQISGPTLCPAGSLGLIAVGLPWPSQLSTEVPAGAEGNNVIEGVGLEFRCGPAKATGVFTGTLSVLVKQRKAQCGGLHPKACADFDFRAEPTLSGESGELAVSGAVKVKGSPAKEIQVCDCDQR